LSHFAASKRLSGYLQGDQAISAPDRGTLRRSIQQVQTWRANIRQEMVKKRIAEFAAYAGSLMLDDIRIRDLELVDGYTTSIDFVKMVDDLLIHWNNFGSPLKHRTV
jgi:hypothetical protein